MKQFLLEDIKAFTTHLFLQPTFDAFFLREAMFKTAATVTIDGAANADYFDTDEGVPEHVTWGSVRSLSFQVIKGNRLPVSFQIILYPDETTAATLLGADVAKQTAFQKVTRYYLNLSYKNRLLTCTTGVSYAEFTVDKSADEAWDRAVSAFLKQMQIPVSEV